MTSNLQSAWPIFRNGNVTFGKTDHFLQWMTQSNKTNDKDEICSLSIWNKPLFLNLRKVENDVSFFLRDVWTEMRHLFVSICSNDAGDGPAAKKVKVDEDLKGGMADLVKPKVTEGRL